MNRSEASSFTSWHFSIQDIFNEEEEVRELHVSSACEEKLDHTPSPGRRECNWLLNRRAATSHLPCGPVRSQVSCEGFLSPGTLHRVTDGGEGRHGLQDTRGHIRHIYWRTLTEDEDQHGSGSTLAGSQRTNGCSIFRRQDDGTEQQQKESKVQYKYQLVVTG